MFFRLLVLFFTLATLVLSVWSLVGSYKNASYLTDNYLLSFQLSNLNLSAVFSEAVAKRDVVYVPYEANAVYAAAPGSPYGQPTATRDAVWVQNVHSQPTQTPATPTENDKRDLLSDLASVTSMVGGAVTSDTAAVASLLSQYSTVANAASTADISSVLSEIAQYALGVSIPAAVATLAAELLGDFSSLIEDYVGSMNALELGLADMYSVGFWGYCKGLLDGSAYEYMSSLGKFGKQFSNKNVNWTYCLPAKVGYKFDPLTVFKHELIVKISEDAQELNEATGGITDTLMAQLLALVLGATYETLGLPGSLKKDLTLLHNLTIAAFALILAGAIIAFISFVFQALGLCFSPQNSCLSCLNFMVMFIVFLVVLLGSALSTGAYIFVRKEVNNEVETFNVRSFLSVQFYALSWSAVAAALLLVIFSFLGYCCGCFHSGKRRYATHHMEPEMRYDHKY